MVVKGNNQMISSLNEKVQHEEKDEYDPGKQLRFVKMIDNFHCHSCSSDFQIFDTLAATYPLI